MKNIIITMVFLFFCNFAYACEINCEYKKYPVCNGYRLKKECKEKDIDVAYVLMLQCGLPYLNEEAKVEYYEKIKCLEIDDDSILRPNT